MVDFDAAVAAVQDPNADPVFLAKIAYENPEFGANVVANPRAYPGLKRWGQPSSATNAHVSSWSRWGGRFHRTESCSRRPRRSLSRCNTRCPSEQVPIPA